MNHSYLSIRSISKTLVIAGVFAVFVFGATDAFAGTIQMRAKNNTHPTYSSASTYDSTVRAEPGDQLSFRMLFLGDSAATALTVDFPANLAFVSGSTATVSGNAATASAVDSDTVQWAFASGTTEIITFNATVAAGNSFTGTDHSIEASFSTNGTPATSDTTTITVGPIVTSVTPSTGNNASAVSITSINGHGFTGTTAVALSDGTSLDLTGATVTDTSISGPNIRVSASHTPGAYWVLVTVTSSGNTLTTNSDATETVRYTATDGIPPQMQTSSNTYVHSTGVLTLVFDETIDVSATVKSQITLADASSGGNSLTLDNATVSTTDSATVTFTLAQADINTISTWGQSVNTLYVHINGSGIFDTSANPLSNQGSRTALNTWTKDTLAPTASITYTQNSAAVTSAKTGALTITATFSEPISTTPQIAINQQGTTDVAATDLTLSGTSRTMWTYAYTVNADDAAAYLDGSATITISNAPDYAANALGTVAGNTLTIDTLVPSPAITTLAGASSGQTGANFSWTSTYSASDFSTYKFYWSTSLGVTSANGTLISKSTSGYSNLGTASTAALALSGLSAGSNYYAVIYICDTAANCSLVSNEASLQTQQNAVITAPVSGGGGGTTSTQTTTSSAKTVSESGGSLSTTLPSGTTSTVTVPQGTFTSNTTISVSEATSSQIASAPLASSIGSVVGSSIVNIVAASSGAAVTTFTQPVTLSFTYTATQLGATDASKLRVAYFNETTDAWVALDSTINATTRTVTASTNHFTLFGLLSFVNPPAPGTEDNTAPSQGQVLGSAVGVYPNGTLLKAPNSPAVWHISADQKHLIRSAAIFESQFNWDDVVTLPSSNQLALYEQGTDVLFSAGTLAKELGNPAVYRVSASGGIAPIVSEAIFFGRGYSFNDVVEVEFGFLAGYPSIAVIDSTDARYTGDLVKLAGAPAVYYVENRTSRVIPSASIFNERAFKFKNVATISPAQFDALTAGTALTYPDGTLVKGDSAAVYVVSDGKKRPIVSAADFEAFLYQWVNIVYVPESLLAALPEAASLKLVIAQN